MALVLKDRVKETTATVGNGTLSLLGASQGFQDFSSIGIGNTTYYCIQGVAEWEVGLGTVGPGTLSRDVVLASSNGGGLVSFSGGQKDVFCTYPAGKAIGTDIGPVTFSVSSAVPNATVNVAKIASAVSTTDGDIALSPKGTGAILAQVPDGTSAGGNKRGGGAVDWQIIRSLSESVASGSGSVISGGFYNKSTADQSVVAGGSANAATGNGSAIGGGTFNQASGNFSTIGGGDSNIASFAQTFIGGGYNNTASASLAAVVGGRGNTVSQEYSIIGGGYTNTLQSIYSFLGGGITNTGSGSYSALVGGSTNTASGDFSFVGGGSTNTASASYATLSGGLGSTASGQYSTVSGGRSNTASATYAAIAGGRLNVASAVNTAIGGGLSNEAIGTYATVAGGELNVASGSYSAVLGGYTNTTSGAYAVVGGGQNHQANSSHSAILGGAYGSTRSVVGYHAFPACLTPVASKAGASQGGLLIIGAVTISALSTILRSNTSSAGATNQLILPFNSAYYFKGTVIATVTGGGDTKSWTFDGQIKKGLTAGSTTLTGSTVTSPYGDAGASTWAVALSADTTNGGLAVTVTGQASTTIRWACKIETTEVTF
jgi:hypothetical protein